MLMVIIVVTVMRIKMGIMRMIRTATMRIMIAIILIIANICDPNTTTTNNTNASHLVFGIDKIKGRFKALYSIDGSFKIGRSS